MERMAGICQLYYDPDRNLMMDEDGYVVFDIYRYITPSTYFLFLKNKEYMCVEVSYGSFVELIYPEEEDCGDYAICY